MDTGTTLIFSVLFGSIGLGYLAYGKKQQKFIPAMAGLMLCVLPYFISNVWAMVGVGAALIIVPWLVRL
jgi:hypothetical protein